MKNGVGFGFEQGLGVVFPGGNGFMNRKFWG
jgi:hypothetical protein